MLQMWQKWPLLERVQRTPCVCVTQVIQKDEEEVLILLILIMFMMYSTGQAKPASFIVAEQLVEIVQFLWDHL